MIVNNTQKKKILDHWIGKKWKHVYQFIFEKKRRKHETYPEIM